jgi:hypothetical protein
MASNAAENCGVVAGCEESHRQNVPAATAVRGQMQLEFDFEKVSSICGD